MKDFIEDLKWRGIADNIVPGIEDFFKNKKNLLYTGIDPTAPSLHIGNLSVLFLLKRFQLKKYKSIISFIKCLAISEIMAVQQGNMARNVRYSFNHYASIILNE